MLAEVVWCVFECDEGASTHLAVISSPPPGEQEPCSSCNCVNIIRRRCTDGWPQCHKNAGSHACMCPYCAPVHHATCMHDCVPALGMQSLLCPSSAMLAVSREGLPCMTGVVTAAPSCTPGDRWWTPPMSCDPGIVGREPSSSNIDAR